MKLKDGFYASSHGIGGLTLDMPTKNPKTRKKLKVKVGDMVRCEAEEFVYPFRGYVERIYNHSAIIKIENTMECDRWLAKSKWNLAVARLRDFILYLKLCNRTVIPKAMCTASF
ncbi:hypothetical protein [Enterococcus durans]|uniref:hypothetical protein n=1 Tax=Enterococcus durans TaxID=53345 RepID=UPI0011BFF883|nr:hypothetical protein [Enterococcus durans]QED60863.1 hypothetical protein FS851_14505 [Enterococcus durans]